jgi:hypothetical protein
VSFKAKKLTKSRFTQALSCPTKLYYGCDSDYANQSLDDPFLAALAEGGFQVGELAKCYFPDGIEITSLDEQLAVNETQALLTREEVVLFEPAIIFDNCLVRIDVLVKRGNQFSIYEVKAKSFDSNQGPKFLKRNGAPTTRWKKYLYDVAFQKWVLQHAIPESSVSAHLMLTDTSARTQLAGLNQHFPIVTDRNGRKRVQLDGQLSDEQLKPPLLVSVNVDPICADIFAANDHGLGIEESFQHMIERFSMSCRDGVLLEHRVGKHCRDCEYVALGPDVKAGKLDGRHACFKRKLGYDSSIFDEPTVLDLWNYRGKDALIDAGVIRLKDVSEEDLKVTPGDDGLSVSERQWLQVQKARDKDDSVWVDREGLRSEMESWVYPLHFIDFETTMVALPFGINRRPYEGIAFQFSHHVVESNGTVRHAGQFLNTQRGVFPNYEFVRALQEELGQDQGTIFKYSAHENTFLNLIIEQLNEDASPPDDREELIAFIQTMTQSKKDAAVKWEGERNMVDLLEVVKKFYFDPRTKGSNSIKYVLPEILGRSGYLQAKYSQHIYGSPDGIQSLNFKNWQWLKFDDTGSPINPYDQLPKLFSEREDSQIELLSNNDSLQNGGAALMAYARMQFERMSDYEHEQLSQALLKYCELDTLAMVMIYESWKHDI